jgi:hypothetical protein
LLTIFYHITSSNGQEERWTGAAIVIIEVDYSCGRSFSMPNNHKNG